MARKAQKFFIFCSLLLCLSLSTTRAAVVVTNAVGRSGVRVNDGTKDEVRAAKIAATHDELREVRRDEEGDQIINVKAVNPHDVNLPTTTAVAGTTTSSASLAMVQLRAQRRTNVTLDAFFCSGNSDCESCTRDSCDWCLWSKSCVSKLEITAECQFNKSVSLPPGAGAWLKTPQMCNLSWTPLIGDWSGFGYNMTGCTDTNANNYMFMATIDNGQCAYGGHHGPSYFPQAYCICSTGGYSTPYGRFCGSGYTGANGQQPCDRGDKCAQMHDWCVGQLGYSSCNCTVGLVKCMRYVQQCGDAGFCGTLQEAIKNVIDEIRPAFEVCSAGTLPYCDEQINCSGHGTCSDYGQCQCVTGWSGYMCDYARM